MPFILNNVQQDLHNKLMEHSRLDVLKFRQGGVTSLVMAFFLVECMSRYCTCVMIAHDRDHTEKLLQRCRLFLDLLKGPKPQLSRINDQELYFSKTHSTFYIGTAGSRNFGRSATITHLHCSEYAFWRDPQPLMAGLLQAVPHDTGLIVKESTANGFGTLHHKQYLQALKGESKFVAVFYPWYIFEEYKSSTPLRLPYTSKELELKQKYGLSDAQLQWRREKIEEFGDEALFCQEYPATPEEAFLVSGGSLFPNAQAVESPDWIKGVAPFSGGALFLLSSHPKANMHYAFGIDVAGGTGGDYSTIQGLCLETGEQVLVYSTNVLPPPTFARVVKQLGEEYNAFLVPESNQHGLSVLDVLRVEGYPLSLIYKDPKSRGERGFKTTLQSKYKLVGILQRMLPTLTLYDLGTVDELRGFGETDLDTLGNLYAEHDDRVIALALACVGLQRLSLMHGAGTEVGVDTKEEGVKARPSNVVDLGDILSRLPTRKRGLEMLSDHLRKGGWTNSDVGHFNRL